MIRPRSFHPAWAPTFACFASAFGLSMLHWSLFNNMIDAASATQTFHGILQHGLGARNSLEELPVFGVHLWILPFLLAMPVFWIFHTYPSLVAVQAIVLALSVPAAYRLALSMGASGRDARRWTWLWALHPMVLGPNCSWGEGYQPMVFAVTPILWSLAMVRESKWGWFLAFLALALACREDVALATFGIGIWVFWVVGNRKAGSAAIILSLAWAFLAVLVLPHLAGGSWGVWKKAFPLLNDSSTPWRMLTQGTRNIFQLSNLGYLVFVYLAWGGFTRKSALHLVSAVPLCGALFLVELWVIKHPFMYYAAPLSPIFFHAALVESHGRSPFGWRWRTGWLLSALSLCAWQGRLLHNGIHGLDRKSLTCMEAKIPRDRSLALYSPRGAARFAWGQDLIWFDPDYPASEFTLVETGRKTAGRWTDAELEGMESSLMSRGARVVYRAPGVRLWSLRDHRRIDCP
jgi:uncharacterized membrane protein